MARSKSRLDPMALAKILLELQMNQAEFAQLVRVGQPTVSRWLSGDYPIPGYVEAILSSTYPNTFTEYFDE